MGRESHARFDAVIIGAGVIGAAIAYELAKKGYRTLNVDRLSAAGYGSTASSCAIVRAHYSTFEGVALAYEGFNYWADWPRYLGAASGDPVATFVRCGSLVLRGRNGHAERIVPLFDAIGVEYEEWSTDRLRDRFPIFDVREYWPPTTPDDERFWEEPTSELPGAVHTPGSGYVNDALLATQNLQWAAEALGAQFLFKREVVAIRSSGTAVEGIELADGTFIGASVVVNVAGPESNQINALAGVQDDMNVRTRALRHEVHHVPAPREFDYDRLGMQVSDGDNGIYFRPDAANHLLVGSEDPSCDPPVWVDHPGDWVGGVTEPVWERQVFRLARRIPDLPIPTQRRGIAALYDVSDDWIPIYDRSALPGFYMAIGTSGNQFKNAGPVGHLMAELIDAERHGHDHDRDPLRVRMRHTGIVLDVGYFSRRRTPHADSSFSVNG